MAEDTAPNLVGKRISTTFRGLLHLPHSIDIANPNIKQIVYDGQGTETSLNLAGSGYGAQVFGDLSITKKVDIGSDLTVNGNFLLNSNLSCTGNINLISGGNINDVYISDNSSSVSLSAPKSLNIGKINLIQTATDYEINFGTNKLFSIFVKHDSPNNLYIKPAGIINDADSPIWINTLTNEVNISNLRLSSIATNTSLPNKTNSYRSVVPVGSVIMFPSLSIPNGWFECNGSEYTISDYVDLFNVIQYTYGSGTGSNFRIPDLRNLFVRGLSAGRTLGLVEMDSIGTHKHASTSNKSLLYNDAGGTLSKSVVGTPEAFASTINSDDLLQGNNIGGGTETRPKNMALVYCIKW